MEHAEADPKNLGCSTQKKRLKAKIWGVASAFHFNIHLNNPTSWKSNQRTVWQGITVSHQAELPEKHVHDVHWPGNQQEYDPHNWECRQLTKKRHPHESIIVNWDDNLLILVKGKESNQKSLTSPTRANTVISCLPQKETHWSTNSCRSIQNVPVSVTSSCTGLSCCWSMAQPASSEARWRDTPGYQIDKLRFMRIPTIVI